MQLEGDISQISQQQVTISQHQESMQVVISRMQANAEQLQALWVLRVCLLQEEVILVRTVRLPRVLSVLPVLQSVQPQA